MLPHPQSHTDIASGPKSPLFKEIDRTETRILAISPGQYGDPIASELHTAEIVHEKGALIHGTGELVEYKALSYCWGEETFDHEVTCNGKSISVTVNLHDALQRVRNVDEPTYFWIDAICINQTDANEKSTHISNMLTIYSEAKEVVVWLGEHDLSGRNLPMPQMEDLDMLISRQGMSTRLYDSSLGEAWARLQSLLYSPWFERIWVKQEFWAAKTLTIRWHDVAIDWDDFVRAMESADAYAIYCMSANKKLPANAASPRLFEDTLAGFLRSSPSVRLSMDDSDQQDPFLQGQLGGTDLRSVLNRGAGCSCSDPRDHVYGLLGMSRTILRRSNSHGDDDAVLNVDYNRKASRVFQDAALYIMRRDKCLNILYLTAFFGGGIDGESIPSWVPDWRCMTYSADWLQESQHMISAAMNETSRSGTFKALCLDTTSHPYCIALSDDGVLTVQGLSLGIIEETKSNNTVEQSLPRHSSAFNAIIAVILDQVDPTKVLDSTPNLQGSQSTEDWRGELLRSINISLASLGQARIASDLADRGYVEVSVPEKCLAAFFRECCPSLSTTAYLRTVTLNDAPGGRISSCTFTVNLSRACFGYTNEERIPAFLLGKRRSFPNTKKVSIETQVWKSGPRVEFAAWLTAKPESSSLTLPLADYFDVPWAVPPTTMPGDRILAVRGGFHPIVLRQEGGLGCMTYIGPATFSVHREETDIPAKLYQSYHLMNLFMEYDVEVGGLLEPFKIT